MAFEDLWDLQEAEDCKNIDNFVLTHILLCILFNWEVIEQFFVEFPCHFINSAVVLQENNVCGMFLGCLNLPDVV